MYEEDARDEASDDLSVLHAGIAAQLTHLEQFAEALSSYQPVLDMLADTNAQSQQQADATLARYNQVFQATVIYLMNASGIVVAASNGGQPDSFVGRDYGFRPYFRQAMAGQRGRYFALGITSGTRGFYTLSLIHISTKAVSNWPCSAAMARCFRLCSIVSAD